MKNLTILVAMILFSCCVLSQATAIPNSDPSMGDEKLEWWHYHYPYFHPKPHWHFPKAFPPLPAGFKPPPFKPAPVVATCLADCKDARKCYTDIAKAYVSRNPAFGSDCCASIVKLSEDCEKTVFGSFHSPFFNSFIKLHCSTQGGSTPSAPTPAA